MSSETDGALHKTDSNGNLNVLYVERNKDGLFLNANNANSDNQWNPDNQVCCFHLERSSFR